MQGWLDKISNFFVDLFKDLLEGLVNLIRDICLWVLDGILTAIYHLLSLIPAPCCVPVDGLQNLVDNLPPFALYVVSRSDISAAFDILACGVAFYLLRKLFTLGQW
jgi:hypothetical protein